MTEAVGQGTGTSTSTSTSTNTSWLSVIWSARRDPAARILNVDLLAVLIAILLPWSTTGVTIAVVLWVIAFGCTVDLRAFMQSLARPICLLPIALFALALLGTLWSDAPWAMRLHAVSPAAKLLALPLLFCHFERSPRGLWVFIAFLASCVALMVVSWIVAFEPNLSLKLYLSRGPYKVESGIAVRNYIDQGQEFTLCAVALAYPVVTLLRTHKIWLAALLAAIALGLVFNMMFVVVSRTALVTMPVMLAVFALLHLRRRTAAAALCVTALLAAVIWNVSPSLRATADKFVTDYQRTESGNTMTGVGSRLVYWEKSLRFIADAPLIGHGTGSIRGLFQRVAVVGQDGVTAEVVGDPHNQTLNVAVQWGVVGVVVLYAMWLSHLLLFRGEGLANWIGLLVVVQNVFTSLFNSHLFDFFEGWLYVLGVGVAGGMALLQRVSHTNLGAVRVSPGQPDSRGGGST
ncbi:O-antigen ligase family protein [Bradyrhizobium canariense]|uniref:O-antigen ligase n=1 Tax=Bradyrhizobium canariense TaxID=255045 RepID=A0A1H1VWW7_9BRAD|nr:O-antigen ligase family protein [Bradyrhizobium canariense]SDS89253.1 O-antigen ligase [Bradyrhizobium canariense]